MKRIRRNYRMSPVVDSVIKLIARELEESEADALSYCVLTQANYIIERKRLIKRLGNTYAAPPILTKAIKEVFREQCRKLHCDDR